MRVLKKQLWPYTSDVEMEVDSKERRVLDEWCQEVFGRRHTKWYSYNLFPSRRTYAFRIEADLLMFKLRCNPCLR